MEKGGYPPTEWCRISHRSTGHHARGALRSPRPLQCSPSRSTLRSPDSKRRARRAPGGGVAAHGRRGDRGPFFPPCHRSAAGPSSGGAGRHRSWGWKTAHMLSLCGSPTAPVRNSDSFLPCASDALPAPWALFLRRCDAGHWQAVGPLTVRSGTTVYPAGGQITGRPHQQHQRSVRQNSLRENQPCSSTAVPAARALRAWHTVCFVAATRRAPWCHPHMAQEASCPRRRPSGAAWRGAWGDHA
jgi:hypothetical protein